MNTAANTQPPEWSLQGFVSLYLMFSLKPKHLKNDVYFGKNLGSMGSVLNLLEGREINHCFYKNVFTRELEKCKHMQGGVEKCSLDRCREKKYIKEKQLTREACLCNCLVLAI